MDKLKVFISSSMRLEPATHIDWLKMRSGVKEAVNRPGLFDAFVIEDHASPDKSNDYMLSKVRECHVYVLILGTELRDGTMQEYREAFDHQKPQLVYELDLAHDKNVSDLIGRIHADDRCTTRRVRADDTLGPSILDDLLEYVVRRFEGTSSSGTVSHQGLNTSRTPPAREVSLALFGESSSLLARRMGCANIPRKECLPNTYLYPLGDAAIHWLLDGTAFDVSEFAPTLVAALQLTGGSSEERAIRLRWNACSAYMAGDMERAVSILEDARAVTDMEARTMVGVLVDLRNLYSSAGDLGMSKALQDEIEKASKEGPYQAYGLSFREFGMRSMLSSRVRKAWSSMGTRGLQQRSRHSPITCSAPSYMGA